jgi:glycerol-3-phosphate acyltransferase PlsY
MKWVLMAAIGYLMGSVSFGILISRQTAHLDIRSVGSGGTGMTNVLRTLGKRMAAWVFAGDCLKGFVPALLGLYLGGEALGVVGGLAAVVGHSYPLYFGFKGGRGVATACGVMLALAPLVAVWSLAVFLIVLLIGRWVSLASMAGVVCAAILAAVVNRSVSIRVMMTACALLVIYRHIPNIKRLLNGTEPKIDLRNAGKR